MNSAEILARERPWYLKAGLAGIVGGTLALLGYVALRAALTGDANFESLESASDKGATVWISGVASCLGYVLIAVPLWFLFRAAQARSSRVKGQFVGLTVVGPVLLALAALLIAAGTQQAADSYAQGEVEPTLTQAEAREECTEERAENGAEEFAEDFEAGPGGSALAACEEKRLEEDTASEAIKDSSPLAAGQYASLAGLFALLFALLYTGLWSMRTGLLTRFWGSLGMAVGIAVLIGFGPLAYFWFIYLGVMLAGWLPTGRPPAWETGEAIPWPTPGEKAAAELEADDGGVIDVESTDPDPDGPPGGGYGSDRRKRKRRD